MPYDTEHPTPAPRVPDMDDDVWLTKVIKKARCIRWGNRQE